MVPHCKATRKSSACLAFPSLNMDLWTPSYTRANLKYQEHLAHVRKFSASRHPQVVRCQATIAAMLATGTGVNQDMAEAAHWYAKAARGGNASAQFNLAAMYAKGEGVVQCFAEAEVLCKAAAEGGHAGAKKQLAAISVPARSTCTTRTPPFGASPTTRVARTTLVFVPGSFHSQHSCRRNSSRWQHKSKSPTTHV